jgi:SAM-dependent methyltransferase
MALEKTPAAEFDRYADSYEQLIADPIRDRFARSAEYFHRRKLEVLHSHLSAAGKPAASLSWLDLGCGRGDLLRIAGRDFAQACGCDVSPESLKYCRDSTVRLQPSIDSVPFDAASFDVVTAACVYHHVGVGQRARLTESVRAVLKPGGIFCIFEHNPRNPVTRRIVERSPVDVNAVLLYPQESIALLKQARFDKISVRYYLFMPEVLGARLRTFEDLLSAVPFGGQYAAFGQV